MLPIYYILLVLLSRPTRCTRTCHDNINFVQGGAGTQCGNKHQWDATGMGTTSGGVLQTAVMASRLLLNIILLLSNRLPARGNRTQSHSSCDTPRHHKHRDSTSSCAQDPFVRTKSFVACAKKKCKPSCKTGCSHHIIFKRWRLTWGRVLQASVMTSL